MSEAVARVVRRRGVLPALVTAAGVFGYLLISEFLRALLLLPWYLDSDSGAQLPALWTSSALSTIVSSLPFAIGVFLAFWQIAPIAASLRLAHVVTRAVLAAIIGAALSFAIETVVTAARHVLVGDLAGAVGSDVLGALSSAARLVLGLAPLVVLGAVLLWGWLQRHPLDYVPRGTLDEV